MPILPTMPSFGVTCKLTNGFTNFSPSSFLVTCKLKRGFTLTSPRFKPFGLIAPKCAFGAFGAKGERG